MKIMYMILKRLLSWLRLSKGISINVYNTIPGIACCFCNKGVVETKIDPCDISIITGWNRPKSKRRDQFFWCHLECFRSKMHPSLAKRLVLETLVDDDKH